MSTSKKSIEQLLGKMSTQAPHSDICKCSMCMKSRLPVDIQNEYADSLRKTMVDRRNPDDPVRPLMKATTAHAIIRAGTSVDMLEAIGLTVFDLPSDHTDIHLTVPQEITIQGKWKHRSKEMAVSGRDASVFGGLGVLLVPQDFSYIDIPKMNALEVEPNFLKKYGAELIPLDLPVPLEDVEDPDLKNLYLVQYDFDKDYIEQYVMKMAGGGGLFVETHPFPHVFTPLSEDCGGAIILGKDLGKGKFTFAAFQIPYGFTLKVDSNTIHGDSFFVGPYAIALTETERADSVLFRKENPSRDIQHVTQEPMATLIIPILAEYRLAKAVNHQMMIDKLRNDKDATTFKLDFFQKLPTDILEAVKDILPLAQTAIDERTSLFEIIDATDDESLESSDDDIASVESASSEEIADLDNKSPTITPKGTESVVDYKKRSRLIVDKPQVKEIKGKEFKP